MINFEQIKFWQRDKISEVGWGKKQDEIISNRRRSGREEE